MTKISDVQLFGDFFTLLLDVLPAQHHAIFIDTRRDFIFIDAISLLRPRFSKIS